MTAQLYVAQVSAKDQRNQNQTRPMRNQPKNREIKTTHTHEKSTQRTQRNQNQLIPMRNQTKGRIEKSKPKTQTIIQKYRNQMAQISPQTRDL